MATTILTGEPYTLAGRRLAFTSWYHVRVGGFAWIDAAGDNVTVAGNAAPDEAAFVPKDRPSGIRLRAERARACREPIIDPDPDTEAGVHVGTILQRGSSYQAWGTCRLHGGQTRPAYFESTDGVTWTRPRLGVVDHRGSRENNYTDGFGGSVFFDPAGVPQERYKAIEEGYITQEQLDAFLRQRPGDFDPQAIRAELKEGDLWWRGSNICAVVGWTSPDGFRWRRLDMPLAVIHSDTRIVCHYDAALRKYVGYFREWYTGPRAEGIPNPDPLPWKRAGRRAISRAETDDFRRFPMPETVLIPRYDMHPADQLYTNCRTAVPHAPDHHLMFPAVYVTADDTTYIDLASSHDGRIWNFVPGAPLLETGTFGSWNGGCVFAFEELLELADGDFALPFIGHNVPHKYSRGRLASRSAYALWPKGRLVGVEAPERGEFSTVAVVAPGRRLYLNAVTRRAGHVKVAISRLDGSFVEGRDFPDAVPLVGDLFRAPVTWRGHDDLGVAEGEAVIIRFLMERATIYYLDFA